MNFESVVDKRNIAPEPSGSEVIEITYSRYAFPMSFEGVVGMRHMPPGPSSSEAINIISSRYGF